MELGRRECRYSFLQRIATVRKHKDLAHAIDTASDSCNEESLRLLGKECEDRLDGATGDERVLLLYFQSNTHSAIVSSQVGDPARVWDWEQPDAVQNVLLLRRAIAEPAFGTIDRILTCQIRTNLANRLYSLGRPVAANEQWLKALETEPRFAKALINRAKAMAFYAGAVYDRGHVVWLLSLARSLLDSALYESAIWESEDRDLFAPALSEERDRIQAYLAEAGLDESFDLNQWGLGATQEEREYRQWCLHERLFLNPLNDAYTDTVSATDVLHLPDHTYKIDEPARFPGYYNLLKQEYVSARYRLYRAIHQHDPDFLMGEVLMLDSGEGQALGHYSEDLKSAFRSAYSIFGKVGLFLNDYFQVGLSPDQVNFRWVWSEKSGRSAPQVRARFAGHRNWLLRGLYFLSKDLFDKDSEEVSEPDAADLAVLRNQAEHRFLSLQRSEKGVSTDTHGLIVMSDFQDKALRLLKMAREALIYLSLAMHREESLRAELSKDAIAKTGRMVPRRIEEFQRPEASS